MVCPCCPLAVESISIHLSGIPVVKEEKKKQLQIAEKQLSSDFLSSALSLGLTILVAGSVLVQVGRCYELMKL